MNYLDLAEIVTGLVITNKLNPHSVNPTTLPDPYDQIVAGYRDGQEVSEIMEKVGLHPIQASLVAAQNVNGDLPADWAKMLDRAAIKHDAHKVLELAARRLRQGEEVDTAKLLTTIHRLDDGHRTLTPLSEVEPEQAVWTPVHWPPIDKYLGGIPKAGLTIVAGPPGTGKTGLLAKITSKMARVGKKSAIFSMEMTMGQLLLRLIEIENLNIQERSLILSSDDPMTPEEIYSTAVQYCMTEELDLIGVDFADLLLRGESRSGAMENVYRTMAQLAKVTRVPVILLAQLNENYRGGIPKVNHLRWSRLAEALGALIILIYNPEQLWADIGIDKRLEIVAGAGYLIVGKSRFGFGKQPGVFAVQVPWDGKAAWGDEVSLPFNLSM